MDDSGKRAANPVVTAATFVFRAGAYARFSKHWNEALDEFGLSRVEGGPGYFHMVDFAAKTKPYYDWPEHVRRERLNILLDAIVDNASRVASTWVPVPQYEASVRKKSDIRLGGPFGMAAVSCFLLLGHWLRGHPEAQIALVLEDGSEGMGQIEKTYKMMKYEHAVPGYSRLYSFTHAGKEVAGLQAADMLAYEMQRRGATMIGGDPRPVRPYILRRLNKIDGTMAILETIQLRRWSDAFEHNFTGSQFDEKRNLITWPDGRIEPLSNYVRDEWF